MFFKSKTIAITFSETETPAEELEHNQNSMFGPTGIFKRVYSK